MHIFEFIKSQGRPSLSPSRFVCGALSLVHRWTSSGAVPEPPLSGQVSAGTAVAVDSRAPWEPVNPIVSLGRPSLDEPVMAHVSPRTARTPPGPKPKVIELLRAERRWLTRMVGKRTAPAESVARARIILTLAESPSVTRASKLLLTSRNTIRLWRDRFLARGFNGLKTLSIPGRAPTISDIARVTLIGMACGLPSDFGVEHRNTWTHESLHQAFLTQQSDLGTLSLASVQRILSNADLKPHRLRLWLHSPDPQFREKITEVCALYKEAPTGSTVLCFDEKTGMQALGRKHPSKPSIPGRRGRQEFEYIRHGTRSLLATFNPHTGEVFAQVRPTRTADDLVEFMEALAVAYPTGEIHIVWDNLNIHHEGKAQRWSEFNRRHHGRFHFHYTPIHASWVNQVELFFGIFSKRVLRYADFDNVEALEQASMAFITHWNRCEKHPFAWKFKGYPLVNSS
jgi:transposase